MRHDDLRQPSDLELAYQETSYRVDAPEGPLVLRVGLLHPAVDALLARHGCQTWAYVTAHNPDSVRLEAEENQRRQQNLEEEAVRASWRFYRGEGVGNSGDWPAEPSLLILGISRQDALELAERYEQAALVFGEFAQAARLLWTGRGDRIYSEQDRL